MASRKLSDLHPKIQPYAQLFLNECDAMGIDILVTCTYRLDAEQDELYAIGRTKPGRRVTNARAGQSKHNNKLPDGTPASLALDFVPLRAGKPVWGTAGNGIDDDPSDDDKDDLELWQRCGALAEKHGFSWAGRWKVFREFPHIEMVV